MRGTRARRAAGTGTAAPALPAALLAAVLAAGCTAGDGRGAAGGPGTPTGTVPSVPASATPTATPTDTGAPASTPPAAPDVTLTTVSRRGTVRQSRWTANYPTLHGLAPAAGRRANAALTAGVDDIVHADDEGPQTVDLGAALSAVDDTYVTVHLAAYVYPDGAAHGYTVFTAYVFERATGRRLTLPDLFTRGDRDSALRAMSTYVRRRLPQVVEAFDDESFRTGTAPDPDNFADVTPLPEGLEVTFGEYQVAPYAAGMPVVVVPWRLLEPYLAVPLPAGDREPPYRDGHRVTFTELAEITDATAADARVGAAALTRVETTQGGSDADRSWALATLPDGRRVALHQAGSTWRVVDVGPTAGCTAFPGAVRTSFALVC